MTEETSTFASFERKIRYSNPPIIPQAVVEGFQYKIPLTANFEGRNPAYMRHSNTYKQYFLKKKVYRILVKDSTEKASDTEKKTAGSGRGSTRYAQF